MKRISLADLPTHAPLKLQKDKIKKETFGIIKKLDELQYLMYAEGKHSILVVLQGMDAAGKDSTIRKVFGSLNPQGVQAHSFKVPSKEELDHDFLWRIHLHTPPKGYIGIFNRSHYEDVLVTRVHGLIDDRTAHQRMESINDFEKHLMRNHTAVLKFYLHISRKEQGERLEARVKDPNKAWKYNPADFRERKDWDSYQKFSDEMLDQCSAGAPWNIIPSDQHWYKDYLIAKKVCDTLESFHMKLPTLKQVKKAT